MVRSRGFARVREIVLEEDAELPKAEQTVFRCRVPKHGAEVALSGIEDGDAVGMYDAMRGIVRDHLEGWNLRDDDGEPVPFDVEEDGRITDERIEELALPHIRELAVKIIESGRLTPAERGKSDA